jgi:hypothetical protein
MQILFFSLIPVGIIILIFSIKLVKKTFSGFIIHEIPYSQKSSEFIINQAGIYSIWHKGQYLRKAPVGEFKPEITDKYNGEKIRLYPSFFRPNTNDGKKARMELFRFSIQPGEYLLNLTEGSSISGIEKGLMDLLPVKNADPDKYFIQVRESQSRLTLLAGIILIVSSGFCIIGGLVIGILANQIFPG